MMYEAQDTFIATMEDGTERFVRKGEALAGNHELVRRDLAASEDDASRLPLFRPMDTGEERPEAKQPRFSAAAAKPREKQQ